MGSNLSRLACLAMAAAPISFALLLAAPASAAPLPYEAAVQANNPYAFYRLNESGISTGTVADDTSLNSRDGLYQGSPIGGVAGMGAASDLAVTFAGTPVGTATQYFGSSALRGFGSSVGSSSYEFVFRTNPGFPTTKQSLFGVFNTGNTTAAEVTLNSQGNDANPDTANTTRLFIRGDDGDAVGVHFTNPTLYDGNYHHLVYTFDASQAGAAAFTAYVDGVPQALTLQQVGTGATDPNNDPDTFSDFGFDPTFAARNVRTTLGGTAVGRQANITLDEAVLYTSILSPAQVQANALAAGVPEPTSLAALAGAGLLLNRRRRRVG